MTTARRQLIEEDKRRQDSQIFLMFRAALTRL